MARGARRRGGGGGVKAVEFRGLRQFRSELRKLEGFDKKAMGEVNRRVAELVADAAKAKAGSVSPQARKAAESLTAGRAQSRASVRIGGARYPFALGAEFGSHRYGQFPPWKGNQWSFSGLSFSEHDTGYWLHPAIRENMDRIVDKYGDELDELVKAAFPH
ncbi:MAG: hypothetical protein M3N32_07760 [Actinomycetota bacterium]|nr:hypothetical protein [Actinomycetota bacterium]